MRDMNLLTMPLPTTAATRADSGQRGESCLGEEKIGAALQTQRATILDGTDPCEGVSAEDILEEGDYVDPAGTEFSYDPDYSMP